MGSSSDKNTATNNAQQGINTAQQYRTGFQNNLSPVQNQMGYNYAQGSTSDMGNQADIMGMYRQIASGELGVPGRTGVGYVGNMDYLTSPGTFTEHNIDYTDPFASYGGYQKMSDTGGYSPEDVANLRARGTAPIRTAYANANREIARQRGLSGGDAANSVAALAKMSREQGQSMSDAMQGVEGGIVNQRNANQLAGLGGMSGIEQQRLQAQIAKGEFNAQQAAAAEAGNINQQWALEQANSAIQGRNLDRLQSVAGQNAGISNAAAQADIANRLAALGGMTNLYGTSPGQSATFGNQLLSSLNLQSQNDLGTLGAMNNFGQNQQNASRIPSNFQRGLGYAQTLSGMTTPLLGYFGNRGSGGGGNGIQYGSTFNGGYPMQGPQTGSYLPIGNPTPNAGGQLVY